MASKWDDRKADLQRMVDDEMTDDAIGVVYGVTRVAIYQVRKRLGIVRGRNRCRKSLREVFAAQESEPQALETYVDAAGLTVTRCPARYAEGCLIESCTARPRR